MSERVDIETAQRDRELMLGELQAAGCVVRSDRQDVLEIVCGYHEDRNPSAQLRQMPDGAWFFQCHAGSCGVRGDVIDIIARNRNTDRNGAITWLREQGRYNVPDDTQRRHPGRRARQPARTRTLKIFPSREALNVYFAQRASAMNGRIEGVFPYRDPDTGRYDVIVYKIRLASGGKTCLQGRQDGERWVDGGWPAEQRGRSPLYNRSELRARGTDPVIVVEGEGKVGALHRLGYLATCNLGGAGKAARADWSLLAGRTVYLWPDHDAPNAKTGALAGIDHMRAVAEELKRLEPPPRVFWIDPDETGVEQDGSDVVDFLTALGYDPARPEERAEEARTMVGAVIADAQEISATADLVRQQHAIVERRIREVPLPWPMLSNLTQALLPGTLTILCGSPGASKSFAAVQIIRWLIERLEANPGDTGAALMLEDDQSFHLNRAIAQEIGEAHYTRMDWRCRNHERVLGVLTDYRERIEALGRALQFMPDETIPDAKGVIGWIRERAMQGYRTIIVDPFSLMAFGEKLWIEDALFIRDAKLIAKRYGCSILLVTHPRKHAPKKVAEITLDDVSGSAFVTRFASTVVWLHYHDWEPGSIDTGDPQAPALERTYNRTMLILKARSGSGEGKRLAFEFSRDNLTLTELGSI